MSIFDGFEGQRTTTVEELAAVIDEGVIALDANVLLDLYTYSPRLRETALKVLKAKSAQIFVPHQAMREFWRNRAFKIASRTKLKDPMETARQEVRGVFNRLDPGDDVAQERIEQRDRIISLLDEATTLLNDAYGVDLDVETLLRDPSADPVVIALDDLLAGRVGASPAKDVLEQRVSEGLNRAKRRIPPGYMDAEKKRDQFPEQGTGDYLVWCEILDHVALVAPESGFVVVSNDQKEDWRVVLPGPDRRVLGARAELIEEARARTGKPMIALATNEFYEVAASAADVTPADKTALVVAADARDATTQDDEPALWPFRGYTMLLETLRNWDRPDQALVIEEAARLDGYVSREQIYELLGFDEDRFLKRFSMPASRVRDELVERGVVPDSAREPLRAVYNGPGKAVGYAVPPEFCEHAEDAVILG